MAISEWIVTITYYILIPLILTLLISSKIRTKHKYLVPIGILLLITVGLTIISFGLWMFMEEYGNFHNVYILGTLSRLFGRGIIGLYGAGLIIYTPISFIINIILLTILIKLK